MAFQCESVQCSVDLSCYLLVPVMVWLVKCVSIMNLSSCTAGNVEWIGIFKELSKTMLPSCTVGNVEWIRIFKEP
jgi:hypothetical protein